MKGDRGDQFEIRLYKGRAEVHYGSTSTSAWTPAWSHVESIPGGAFPDAVAAVRSLVPEAGTGIVKRFEWMGAAEARWRKREDVAAAGGGDVVVNQYRVQMRPTLGV